MSNLYEGQSKITYLMTGLTLLTKTWYIYGINLLTLLHVKVYILTSSMCCCSALLKTVSQPCAFELTTF